LSLPGLPQAIKHWNYLSFHRASHDPGRDKPCPYFVAYIFFLLLSPEKSIITRFATFRHLSYLTNRRFALTEQEIQQEVTAIVAEVTEMDKDEIWEKRDANFFKELEVDSLLALEILAMIEKKFKIQIPEERLVDITCLNATIDLTKSILAESGRL